MKLENVEQRKALSQANRIVIKFGSRVLVDRTWKPDIRRIQTFVKDIAWLFRANKEIVVVSSGAIAVGGLHFFVSQKRSSF